MNLILTQSAKIQYKKPTWQDVDCPSFSGGEKKNIPQLPVPSTINYKMGLNRSEN